MCWVPYSFCSDLANGSLSEDCFVFLYTDDLLVYKIITDQEDYSTLQSDLNSFAALIR